MRKTAEVKRHVHHITLSSHMTDVTSHSPGGSHGKEFTANARDKTDANSIPGLGKSLGGGNGNLLQYSCLEYSMDRGGWQAAARGLTKNRT